MVKHACVCVCGGRACFAITSSLANLITFMHLADAFIQSNLQCIQVIFFLGVSMRVPWELNPRPFVLVRQCSTSEP